MNIKSKKTIIFDSNDLTRSKYYEIYKQALDIRDLKNIISNEVHNDIFKFLEMSKFDFSSYMTENHKGEMSSNLYKQLYRDVFTSYDNKFEAIKYKMIFEHKTYKGINYYKKDTIKNKKGDFKSYNVTKTKTNLSHCLTYLARYGNENSVEYIQNQLLKVNIDNDKYKYYKNILDKIDKYGFERLYSLALMKRNNVLNRYNKYPIEFTKLTFSGRSRKKQLFGFNKNYNSTINAFATLSWTNETKTLDIPVKYAKCYHGEMKSFLKKTNDYEYTITINEKTKQVRVHFCIDCERLIPSDKENFVGIDVNIKHNLFSLSNETTYDYNRELVNDYIKFSKQIDNLKTNKDYKIGKRKQYKLDKLKEKIIKSNQQLISCMCKDLKEQGYDHIVMEDLDNSFGKSYIKKDSEDINFNRIVKFIGLSSLKNEVEHITRKYDISVSFVHPHFTSKMCHVCGCIDDNNRKTQDVFHCVNCGYIGNADYNASVNIKYRVFLTVLRNMLLKQSEFNTFKPSVFHKDEIKKVLISCRYSDLIIRENIRFLNV